MFVYLKLETLIYLESTWELKYNLIFIKYFITWSISIRMSSNIKIYSDN